MEKGAFFAIQKQAISNSCPVFQAKEIPFGQSLRKTSRICLYVEKVEMLTKKREEEKFGIPTIASSVL